MGLHRFAEEHLALLGRYCTCEEADLGCIVLDAECCLEDDGVAPELVEAARSFLADAEAQEEYRRHIAEVRRREREEEGEEEELVVWEMEADRRCHLALERRWRGGA